MGTFRDYVGDGDMFRDPADESERDVRCVLYADPRIDSDQKSIRAFNSSGLIGVMVPTGASAGEPELVCGDRTIIGNEPIQNYLRENQA
ncbi:MAG TPA: hypothetical protein VE135_11185 [Pyrinomonadaceae bacterium]|jgi:hypothetical protein|nr:hypothetical protein [Pyrinomonadaceae bacterium]